MPIQKPGLGISRGSNEPKKTSDAPPTTTEVTPYMDDPMVKEWREDREDAPRVAALLDEMIEDAAEEAATDAAIEEAQARWLCDDVRCRKEVGAHLPNLR